MATGGPEGPEWITATIADVVQYGDGGERWRVRCRVGLVHMPDSGDIQLAAQVDGRDLFILPPHTTAAFIAKLREGLGQM